MEPSTCLNYSPVMLLALLLPQNSRSPEAESLDAERPLELEAPKETVGSLNLSKGGSGMLGDLSETDSAGKVLPEMDPLRAPLQITS